MTKKPPHDVTASKETADRARSACTRTHTADQAPVPHMWPAFVPYRQPNALYSIRTVSGSGQLQVRRSRFICQRILVTGKLRPYASYT